MAWLRDELLGFLGEVNRADEVVPLTGPDTSFCGGNFGFRKSVCEGVGLFDSALGRKGTVNIGGKEVDFYRRLLEAGSRVWWTPKAVIRHRIQAAKLNRRYFYDLHFRMGRVEVIRTRHGGPQLPPRYLFGQLLRAMRAALQQRVREGGDATVRREMNVAYFVGQINGWASGRSHGGD
jgi:GT2 family glycosyltransferase